MSEQGRAKGALAKSPAKGAHLPQAERGRFIDPEYLRRG
jgi:hypothetical protein